MDSNTQAPRPPPLRPPTSAAPNTNPTAPNVVRPPMPSNASNTSTTATIATKPPSIPSLMRPPSNPSSIGRTGPAPPIMMNPQHPSQQPPPAPLPPQQQAPPSVVAVNSNAAPPPPPSTMTVTNAPVKKPPPIANVSAFAPAPSSSSGRAPPPSNAKPPTSPVNNAVVYQHTTKKKPARYVIPTAMKRGGNTNQPSRSVPSQLTNPEMIQPTPLDPQDSNSSQGSPTSKQTTVHTHNTVQNRSQQQSTAPRRPTIDPSQIPTPGSAAFRKVSADAAEHIRYKTRSGLPPPAPSSNFIAEDEGNANPRFIRLTTHSLPTTKQLASDSALPMAAILQPFAPLHPAERPIDFVDCGPEGPDRCGRCTAYVNPFVRWVDGGTKWICNICDMMNESEYGKRQMHAATSYSAPTSGISLSTSSLTSDRVELARGSVEFAAPQALQSTVTTPPVTIVLIDVSIPSMKKEICQSALKAINASLPQFAGGANGRLGIRAFDGASVTYFTYAKSSVRICSMNDMQDPFAPLPSSHYCMNVNTYATELMEILQVVEDWATKDNRIMNGNTSLGSAILSVLDSVKQCDEGGRVLCIASQSPTTGCGALTRRYQPSDLGTERESKLYLPSSEAWAKIGQECCDGHLCVELYLLADNYIDIASLAPICRQTGGKLRYIPNYHSKVDSNRFSYLLHQSLIHNFVYNATFKVRTSKGLGVAAYIGHFVTDPVSNTVKCAGMYPETSFGVMLTHQDKLNENEEACVQFAVVYNNADGERRLLVHTICVPVTSKMQNLFRSCDCETIVAWYTRICCDRIRVNTLSQLRDTLVTHCVKALAAYRRHCAQQTTSGQLVLPEALKMLPLYILSCCKSPLLRSGSDVSIDMRVFLVQYLMTLAVGTTIGFVYPRLYALHDLTGDEGKYNRYDGTIMPAMISLSTEKVKPEGVYLLEDSVVNMVWVGKEVDPSILQQLFNVESFDAVPAELTALPECDNELSNKCRAIVYEVQNTRPLAPQLVMIKAGCPMESQFVARLVEDKNVGALSYVDFLVHIHKRIYTMLASN